MVFPKTFPKENFLTDKQAITQANEWIKSVRGEATQKNVESLNDMTKAVGDKQKVVVECTDERNIDINSVESRDRLLAVARVPGGAAGLIYALEDAGVNVERESIIKAAKEVGLSVYNHMDNIHGTTDHKVGCGYLGIMAMEGSSDVYGHHIDDVHEYISKMEKELNVPTLVLEQEHVAQNGGFFINLYPHKVMSPSKCQNAFFSLDLGLISARLIKMAESIKITADQQKAVLINLTRDNMIACYVLSGGAIDQTKFMIIGGDANTKLRDVVTTAYENLVSKKRVRAMDQMIRNRKN